MTRRMIWRMSYQMLNRTFLQQGWKFVNYGYADFDGGSSKIALQSEDEPDRCFIQLYHRATDAVDLRGKDVLEIGSGRGGGADYFVRYRGPKSYLGVDRAPNAVAFCNRIYPHAGLSFAVGDAESLFCPSNSFEVVINIESSHCYGSMERFSSEVYRVLKPGGYFVWADFRSPSIINELRTMFSKAGFTLAEEKDITSNVLKALDQVDDRKREAIEEHAPRILTRALREFAAVRGTEMYKSFLSGRLSYYSCTLQKR